MERRRRIGKMEKKMIVSLIVILFVERPIMLIGNTTFLYTTENSTLKRQLEFRLKLVITFQIVCVFIPIDLTKWNRSQCWLILIFQCITNYKKGRMQIETRYGTRISIRKLSAPIRIPIYALTVLNKCWGRFRGQPPPPVWPFLRSAEDVTYRAKPNLSLKFAMYFFYFQLTYHVWPHSL